MPKKNSLKLRSVSLSLTVSDLGKSTAWYRDVLGFSVVDEWKQDGIPVGVEMGAGDVSFALTQDDWKKGRDRARGEALRIYFMTGQNIDKMAERVKAAGGRLAREPYDEPWGPRAFAIDDPDGFKITITNG